LLVHPPSGGRDHLIAMALLLHRLGAVSDAGEGIAPENLEHVFERFWRPEPSRSRTSGGGSSLGPAIVEAIVTAHGGTVGVTSTVGEGTTVTVTLPG
jgi:two-component system OmpR family sensor kinase